MTDTPRLIEHAFPLKQASLDSVHEKNVRHGHISTLHIWPARRPLAACRAALIATLLPDPGTPEKRQELCEKIGGKVVKEIERKKLPNGQIVEREKEATKGGILHWGRETTNADTLEWFRKEIRKAYGGRAPKVLDPFAGGGAIPLEAMRLGCEATAVDINPVAWFILKCTLEYPQKLAGQTHPLPDFILRNEDFMRRFFKAKGHTKTEIDDLLRKLGYAVSSQKALFELPSEELEADLAWHVRAWGQWVLDHARRELAQYYPTYADFEPLNKVDPRSFEKQPMKLVPLKDDGKPDIDSLNAEFSKEYLADKRNPRWVAKPTVAYLWARTVKCKNCRATVPLLKTRWLCKKDRKRVVLTMEPNADKTGVVFGIDTNPPIKGGNGAQRNEHEKKVGAGTMSRSGVQCPCCGTIMSGEDIRVEGRAGRLGAVNSTVITDAITGKEYRKPTQHELEQANEAHAAIDGIFSDLPYGHLTEPTPAGGGQGAARAFSVQNYGFMHWGTLFTSRQLISLGSLVRDTAQAYSRIKSDQYPDSWQEAIAAYLACAFDFTVNRNSQLCTWTLTRQTTRSTFARFALPVCWDFSECSLLEYGSGGYPSAVDWIGRFVDHSLLAAANAPLPRAIRSSAIQQRDSKYDVIVTDPPYYDSIPYSDLMDYFYVWLRRLLYDLPAELSDAFSNPTSPKWNEETADGELIDDETRHEGDSARSKKAYEDGMARAFSSCSQALHEDGRLVVVFANKQPDAWETLVSAIIRAGFVVDGSWPIQTEMSNRTRALTGSALASSVWLVCRKRSESARPGWDNRVLDEMRENISDKLREFWDAGIRGPDFVWAATGPALEAYSKHPVVKMANNPGHILPISDIKGADGKVKIQGFLTHVRRIVVDFVVGRVLSGDGDSASDDMDVAGGDRLDEPTAYYLLHRHDFGMDEAPAGACILYAVSCGISDRQLSDWDLISFGKGKTADTDTDEAADADAEADPDDSGDSGSKVKLKTWAQRKGKWMGLEAPSGKPIPLIDRVHRMMHLWKAGDLAKVDEYIDGNGLRRQELFKRLLQSLIELSPHGSDERSLLESLSNHLGARGATRDKKQGTLAFGMQEQEK